MSRESSSDVEYFVWCSKIEDEREELTPTSVYLLSGVCCLEYSVCRLEYCVCYLEDGLYRLEDGL